MLRGIHIRKLNGALFFLACALAVNAGADETIVARIECPAESRTKVVWPDHVGDDPKFSRESPPDEWIVLSFTKIEQVEQRVTCRYALQSQYQLYEYNMKRKISSCKKVTNNPRAIDCVLK